MIGWCSWAQRNVTITSTKSEYVALSETEAQIIFCIQVLEFLTGNVKYPVIVLVTNVGAIFLSENSLMSQRTKHIDVCYDFVQKYIKDGTVKIVLMRSKKNHADIMTTNVGGETYEEHGDSFMAKNH